MVVKQQEKKRKEASEEEEMLQRNGKEQTELLLFPFLLSIWERHRNPHTLYMATI